MEHDHITPLALGPARAYREHLYHPNGEFGRWLEARFTVLARAGESVGDAFEVGDVVLHAVLGHPGERGDCVVVSRRGVTRRRDSARDEPSGWYVVGAVPGSASSGGVPP